MNQQRSRRFRSSREAKEKEEARKESVALWKCMYTSVLLAIFCSKSIFLLAMGKEVLDDEKTQESWDSNAITPGTPFMHLLASSLRYWVAQKMNMDPGWKDVSGTSLPSLKKMS
jgi:5'-3' exoribonuclease 2